MSASGLPAGEDQREFARINVTFPANIQPLDAGGAESLRVRILTRPTVWAPSNEPGLRDLAASSSGGHEPLLAEAILELTTQVVRLRRRLLESDGPVKPARVSQLSGGGGRLTSDLALEPGDRFEIRFEDDDDIPPITALGKVVHRTDRDGTCGFSFETMHPHDQDRLIRAIYQLQRRELRKAHAQY